MGDTDSVELGVGGGNDQHVGDTETVVLGVGGGNDNEGGGI